ncbi:MAG TPA: hypothetical protein VIF33_05355 [Casimicrobiaceae bacterium]
MLLQSSPIIVKLIEPPHDPTGVGAAIIAALGLTGVITVAAVTLGLLVGALMFWLRSRRQ